MDGSTPGWFFVLEGSDGSGKATQLRLLKARLEAAGYDVEEFDFPRYDQPSSYFIKQYLDGGFGPAGEVSPYTSSLFYALDRFEAAPLIRQAISDGKIVLSNRYVGSNMAHQGAKFGTESEQRGFFLWADSLEFQLMGIPRPVLNIFLRLPVGVSRDLLQIRAKKEGRKLDEHERNEDFLKKSLRTYDLLCQLFPKDFKEIDSAPSGQLLSFAQVSDLVWAMVRPMLPPPSKPGKSRVINLDQKAESKPSLTLDAKLDSSKQKIDSPSKKLIISQLLLSSIWGSVDNSVNYELIWSKAVAHKAYHRPENLRPNQVQKYEEYVNFLIKSSKRLEDKLRKAINKNARLASAKEYQDALRAIVPMSANVMLDTNNTSLDRIRDRLLDNELPEAKEVLAIQLAADRNLTQDQKDSDSSKKKIKQIIDNSLASSLAKNDERVSIASFTPSNEFELIPGFLYTQSDKSLDELDNEVDMMKYEQKFEILKSASSQKNTALLSRTSYHFDVIGDQAYLESLLSLKIVERLETQAPSPRLGYDVPKIIEELDTEEIYINCFDRSLDMYSQLQSFQSNHIASYACLVGHRLRFQFTVNASSIVNRLHSGAVHRGQQGVLADLIAKIAEKHPGIGEMLLLSLRELKIPEQVQPKTSNVSHRRRSRISGQKRQR